MNLANKRNENISIHNNKLRNPLHIFRKKHIYSEKNQNIPNIIRLFKIFTRTLPYTEYFYSADNFRSCKNGFWIWATSVCGVTHGTSTHARVSTVYSIPYMAKKKSFQPWMNVFFVRLVMFKNLTLTFL